jgi:hypothetical protein
MLQQIVDLDIKFKNTLAYCSRGFGIYKIYFTTFGLLKPRGCLVLSFIANVDIKEKH